MFLIWQIYLNLKCSLHNDQGVIFTPKKRELHKL